MPAILLYWPIVSEADVGGTAADVGPSHQYFIMFCCRASDGSRGAVWLNDVCHGSAYEAKLCHQIPPYGKTVTHWHSSMSGASFAWKLQWRSLASLEASACSLFEAVGHEERRKCMCRLLGIGSLSPHLTVRNMVTGKSRVRELGVHLPQFTVLLWLFSSWGKHQRRNVSSAFTRSFLGASWLTFYCQRKVGKVTCWAGGTEGTDPQPFPSSPVGGMPNHWAGKAGALLASAVCSHKMSVCTVIAVLATGSFLLCARYSSHHRDKMLPVLSGLQKCSQQILGFMHPPSALSSRDFSFLFRKSAFTIWRILLFHPSESTSCLRGRLKIPQSRVLSILFEKMWLWTTSIHWPSSSQNFLLFCKDNGKSTEFATTGKILLHLINYGQDMKVVGNKHNMWVL